MNEREFINADAPTALCNQWSPSSFNSILSDSVGGRVARVGHDTHGPGPHTRLLQGLSFSPEDLSKTYGALFFTRVITHICAPVFFLLAGAGAYLSVTRGKSLPQVARFFWTRGHWLIFLELTVLGFAWNFAFASVPVCASDLGDGHGLPFVYLMWFIVLLILYLPCRSYMVFKSRHRDWGWLSYL